MRHSRTLAGFFPSVPHSLPAPTSTPTLNGSPTSQSLGVCSPGVERRGASGHVHPEGPFSKEMDHAVGVLMETTPLGDGEMERGKGSMSVPLQHRGF